MDNAEKYFELLLSEKKLADSMVGAYADLSLKVFGMFGAGGVLLGWLLSKEGGGHLTTSVGVACVALALASCGIVAQAVATYSLTLGYIEYRHGYLNDAFKDLLNRPDFPIQAVKRWANGAARTPTTLASALIAALHLVCCIALLVMAAFSFQWRPWALVPLSIGWVVLAVTVVTELTLFNAMKTVFSGGR